MSPKMYLTDPSWIRSGFVGGPSDPCPDGFGRYLSNKVDLDSLTRGARIALRIARSKPLVDHLIFNEKPNDNKEDIFWLADANPDLVSDHDIQDWVRKAVRTIYHPVSAPIAVYVHVSLMT